MGQCHLSMKELGVSTELFSFLKSCVKNAKSLEIKLRGLALQLNLSKDVLDTESKIGQEGSALFSQGGYQETIFCVFKLQDTSISYSSIADSDDSKDESQTINLQV